MFIRIFNSFDVATTECNPFFFHRRNDLLFGDILHFKLFSTVADKGKRAATAKRCTYRNDAEPKTHKHTKQMQQQHAGHFSCVDSICSISLLHVFGEFVSFWFCIFSVFAAFCCCVFVCLWFCIFSVFAAFGRCCAFALVSHRNKHNKCL